MRLIDADAVKRILAGSRFKYIRNFLNKQPTIDAVPVVRCKDCKRFVENKEALVTYCKRELKNLYVKPDDFCSYGERKDGAENV